MSESTSEQDSGSAGDKSRADIGIVCALPIELAAFLDRCDRLRKYTGGDFVFRGGIYDGIRIVVAQCGIGFARARRGTQSLLEAHSPAWVLSCGFCGGLRDDVKIGDIVMADSIVDQHGNLLSLDWKPPSDAKPHLHVGRLLTSDELVRTVDEKRRLAEAHEALAVDLESLAVAQVCQETKTRFLAVRAVSDDLSADLPAEALSVIGETGSLRLGAAVRAVWKKPGNIKMLWRLRESAHEVSERLATFLDGVVTQLHSPDP